MSEYKPNVFGITATCGRNHCVNRMLSMFIDQDYDGVHTMFIFNNSDVDQKLVLPELPDNKRVILLNNARNSVTWGKYGSLGEIYNDILNFIPKEVEVIFHMDDDDAILPNHITEGIRGLERNGTTAYKPRYSWFRHAGGIEKMNNTLEPSIFVKSEHIRHYGYTEGKSVSQHLEWVNPLVEQGDIASEIVGPSTLVYNWGHETVPVFKTSGAGDSPQNFDNYRNFSQDHGDGTIHVVPKETYQHLINVPI